MKQQKISLEIKLKEMIASGKAEIMSPEKVAAASQRINKVMHKARREFKKKSKLSEIRASKIIINA